MASASRGGSDEQGQVVRGAILLAVAVVLGLALLTYGFPDGGETTAGGDGDGAGVTDGGDTGPTIGEDSGTSAPATTADEGPRPPAEVTVLVANGSGVPGVAGSTTDTLNGAGYVTVEPANADATDYTESVVYFVGEDQAEAEGVATALGLDPGAAEPMPDPVPTEDADLRGATVLVVVGADLAG